MMLIETAPVVEEFCATINRWCTSKDIADDREDVCRTADDIIATTIAEAPETLTTIELSDFHKEDKLFVDLIVIKGVWPAIPRPRP
jgi:hypothetical protein